MNDFKHALATRLGAAAAGVLGALAVGFAANLGCAPVHAAVPPLAPAAASAALPAPSAPPGEQSPRASMPLAIGPAPGAGWVRLPGHVLDVVSRAIPIALPAPATPMSLTVTLKRDDEAGFARYLQDVYDVHSAHYRRFLTQARLARRFGPSRTAYATVVGYLESQGLEVSEGSKNRLTVTVRGPRAAVERAFSTRIADYKIGADSFYANTSDPALPRELAEKVTAISGLSDLAHPHHAKEAIALGFAKVTCILLLAPIVGVLGTGENVSASETALIRWAFTQCVNDIMSSKGYDPPLPVIPLWFNANTGGFGNSPPFRVDAQSRAIAPATHALAAGVKAAATTIDGTGQTIGLLEFDTFNTSDVANFLSLASAPSTLINNLSVTPVNGGVATPGAGEDEVLLDIDDVFVVAPGAKVKVFDAPFDGQATSYTAVFNAMINGGVTIISNSWASCEDQTTLAEVRAIDQVLQSAAASGISVFNGAGDSGSTCLDGSANTIAVPADSPNATAVGGSSLLMGPGFTYQSETWWNGSAATPPTGQGGFGTSRYFTRPSYQDGLNGNANRSVPDVVANADPAQGFMICQADNGGCPNGLLYGGTSVSTPSWAAFAALLNQSVGKNLGNLNALIYPLSATAAFHSAASMQSDFAHVGLGSPNLTNLALALAGKSVGAVSPTVSTMLAYGEAYSSPPTAQTPTAIPSDGKTPLYVVVHLMDANGNSVSGKSVRLTGSGSASITPASAVTSVGNGTATFTVTDANAETVTFSATDSTDGITLTAQQGSIVFAVPPAVSAGIDASASQEPADGNTAATVTVTLKDALGRPTPGKTVTLSNGGTNAVMTGPTPGVTNAAGQIQFSATDLVAENVTFTAIDVSDGNLPVPGSATVDYSNSATTSCNFGVPPKAGSGYAITAYLSGFPAATSLNYANVNFGCTGANNPTFASNGEVLIGDFLTGGLYQTGVAGGAVSTSNLLTTLNPAVASLLYGKDGSLYYAQSGEGGYIAQLDPATGTRLRYVATNLTCPAGLAIDPLSGDLFFDDECTNGGTDDPTVYRIIDPANSDSTRPTAVVPYATLPKTPNGGLAFAPDGTLYAVSGYYYSTTAPVEQISPTTASTVSVTPVTGVTSDFGIAIGQTNADGSAASLIVEPAGTLSEVPIATPSAATVIATGGPGVGVIGPDGCLYSSHFTEIYRIAGVAGGCSFAPTSPAPSVALSPSSVPSSPAQGTSQTFTATLHNVSPLSGVPVLFQVNGVNRQVASAMSDANGHATFTYTGVATGGDTVTAVSASGATTLTSNITSLTWVAGKHATFLTLNSSPQGGIVSQPVTVVASLSDRANAGASLAGETITFTLGASTCSATTAANGQASCVLTPAASGSATLTAQFAGTTQYTAASESTRFNVAVTPAPPPTVSLSVSPTTISAGGTATLTWSSTGATSCTASGSWSGTQAVSGSQPVTPASNGTYTYVLECSGNGGTASATAVLSASLVAVTVTAHSGGGALSMSVLLVLGCWMLVQARLRMRSGSGAALIAAWFVAATLLGSPRADAAPAAESATQLPAAGGEWFDPLYFGLRVGGMTTRADAGSIEDNLAALGHPGIAAAVDTSAIAGTLYVGYAFAAHAGFEFAYTHRSAQAARLAGTVPSATGVASLLADTADSLRGYGDVYALTFRPRFALLPDLSIDPRIGPFIWSTKVSVAGAGAATSATHEGGGVTAGIGTAYRLWRGLELGIGIDYFRGNPRNLATLYSGSVEWRFGR